MIEGLPLLAWPRHKDVLTILIFHRVLPVFDPLRPGEVVAEIFERQMRLLAKHFAVLPLIEAVAQLRRGKLPRRACCITFDDGYADNLTVAVPILNRYRLPAAVFVATGYLDGGRMFNDSVVEVVARATGPALDLRDIGLGEHSLVTPADRLNAVNAILGQIKYRPPNERTADVARLLELADCGPLPGDIMLTSDQVRELSRCSVEIGGHTVTHNILTTLNDDQAREEMLAGKQKLEALIGKKVTAFAYPNGRPHRDYALHHVAMVREAGFELALTTASGVASVEGDFHQLPRFTPWGTSVPMLSARMMRNAWTGKAAATC